MSYSAPVSTLTPPRLRAALRSYVWVILLLAALGAVVGLGLGAALPQTWSATTKLIVTPLDGNAYNPSTQGTTDANLETEAQIAGSDVVTAQVAANEGLGISGSALSQHTDVAVQPNTQVLGITYHSSEKTGVAKVSGAIAQMFLDYRAQRRDDSIQFRQDTIDSRIKKINAQIASLSKQTPPPSLQLKAYGGQLLNLRVQAAGLASSSTSPGEILSQATPRRDGLALPGWALPLGGALLGAILGLAFAAGRERRSDVVRSDDELADLDVDLLGHQRLHRKGHALVDANDDVAVDVAAVVRHASPTPATVAVSSDLGGDTRNPLPAGLAHELHRAGAGVLLVDAASTSPSDQPGLSDLLLDENLKLADLVAMQDGGIAVLDVGRRPGDIAPLSSTPRFAEVMDQALAHFDWTVLSTPSESTPTGRSLLRHCRHWVCVVTLNHTRRSDIDHAAHWSRVHGVELLGFVLSESSRRRAAARPARADA